MEVFSRIAEERISEAIRNGELENLPGRGKPLHLGELSCVPEELRMSYTILKNAGVLPEELQLQREIVSLQKLLSCCHEDDEKTGLKKKLNEKLLRFNLLMEKRQSNSSAWLKYKDKLYGILGR